MAQEPSTGPWPSVLKISRRDGWRGEVFSPSPNSQIPTHNLEEKVSVFMKGWPQIYPQVLGSSGPKKHHSTYNNWQPLKV
jgi:hypothetical protein